MPITYDSIFTQTLNAPTSSITFSSIPQTFTDLVVVYSVQDNTSGTGFSNVQFHLNSDTGANYSWTGLYGNGTSATSHRSANATAGWGGYMSSISGVFSPGIMHIQDYSNTTTFKSAIVRSNFGALSPNTTTVVELTVSTWRNTAAITTLKLNGAISFATGSTFTLYGIKAA